MLEATSNMAAGSKSLSEFDGLPWSSWAEHLESTKFSDEEEEKKWKVPSGVMRLYSSDMEKFGLFPETEMFCTVVCNECGAVVKPQGLLNHTRVRHKELLREKSLSLDKLNKLSVNDNSLKSVKYALNEKLMSKFVLNDKIISKSSNDKLLSKPSSPNEKHSSKSSSDKYATEKIASKSSDKVSSRLSEKLKPSSDKLRTGSDKLKLSSDKFFDDKNEIDKSFKSASDYAKSNDLSSYKPNEKVAKLSTNEKLSKSLSEKYSSKFSVSDERDRKSPSLEKLFSRSNSSEKLSVKSVLSEKLLSKAANSDKLEARVIIKPLEKEVVIDKPKSTDTMRPSMKSLLKEKVLQNSPTAGGGSLLRSAVSPSLMGATLSPPVLIPQNRALERLESSNDMPVLSRKRRYRERKTTTPAQLDLDRHCGVWCSLSSKHCVRSLTCKVHSISLRRSVAGRCKPFDTLLLEHRRAKESLRLSQEDQDGSLESFSERVATPGGSTNSSTGASPSGSPSASFSSRTPSPSTSPSPKSAAVEEGATALLTPCDHTSPRHPMASYQYPPFPPPLSTSPAPAPAPAPALSQYLNTPLLNVALPGLGPNHSPRPPDSHSARLAAKEAKERGLMSKNRQPSVKHAAFPPKPLRACLFQGRKSSGMFVMQRQLEAVRTAFSISMVRSNKLSGGHAPLSCRSPPPTPMEAMSMSASLAHTQNTVIPTEPASRNSAAAKSVVGTFGATKTVINEPQQRPSRPQKVTILPSAATNSQRANLPSSLRLPVTSANQQGVLRVPVNLKAVLPKPTPTTPIRYTIAARENSQFHMPNILTASRVKNEERGQAGVGPRVKPDHVISTLVPQLGAPVAVAIANGPDSNPEQTSAAVPNDKMQQGLRVTVPTTVPQQITYLTAAPVTFQQIPVLSPQVLSQLQLQSKAAGGGASGCGASIGGASGGLKLVAGSTPRPVLLQQEQDSSAPDS